MKTVVSSALILLIAVFVVAFVSLLLGMAGVALTILTYVGGFAIAVWLIGGFIVYALNELREHFSRR